MDLKIDEVVSKLIVELRAIQGIPVHLLTRNEEFSLPRMIGVGGGRALYVNAKIDNYISQLAELIYSRNDKFRRHSKIGDFRPVVRSLTGAALTKIDLDDAIDRLSTNVTQDLLNSLEAEWDARTGTQEHCFACVLFGFSVPAFDVGPVRIETRNDWLLRRLHFGDASKVTVNRVQKTWAGKILKPRKPSLDSSDERDILDLIGGSKYVASVRTDGLTQGFGRERALIAIRICLTAIALFWQTPSKRLQGFNLSYDREMRSQVAMTVAHGHLLVSRQKVNISVDGTFRLEDWLNLRNENKNYFDFYGILLDSILSPSSIQNSNTTLRKLFHSLLWFHEASRELSPLIATVKYAASMDAPASGARERGILKAFENVLMWRSDQQIFSDGTTLNSAISRIYGQGRSRTIHGNNDQVDLDWSTISARAEQLSKHLLLACLNWAAENKTCDIGLLVKPRKRKPVRFGGVI